MAKLRKLDKDAYEAELLRLQTELVAMQDWVRATGARVVVVFEGRDAAGKGGAIKRVTEYLNPRVAPVIALPAPTERERGQWYFQRYVPHLPARGEIVLLDRSWYNRAGVERVMGFCSDEEYDRFLRQCPVFERLLVEDGIMLRKYWFSVSDAEQLRRFKDRLNDPLVQWKLSPMDLESLTRWEDYSRAKDEMLAHTDIAESPWFDVEAEDKKRARVNMIAHLLSTIPYQHVKRSKLTLPERPAAKGYERPARDEVSFVPDHAASLERAGKDKKGKGKKGKKSKTPKNPAVGDPSDGGAVATVADPPLEAAEPPTRAAPRKTPAGKVPGAKPVRKASGSQTSGSQTPGSQTPAGKAPATGKAPSTGKAAARKAPPTRKLAVSDAPGSGTGAAGASNADGVAPTDSSPTRRPAAARSRARTAQDRS